MRKEFITVASLCASEHFQKYCLNPSPDDKHYWEKWIKEHPEHKDTFEEAQELIAQLSLTASLKEVDVEWNKIERSFSTNESSREPQKVTRKIFLKYAMGIAATILILLGGSFFSWWNTQPDNQIVETGFGETKTHVLPDNSKVILNANSRLTYDANWKNSDTRSLNLTGEAFFTVNTNKQKPLVVKTLKGNVNVFGTTFNVKQRSDQFQVTLVEGEVVLATPNQELKMVPGEQILIDGDELERMKVDVEVITAWSLGRLVFKNETVENIIVRLQQEFDWEVNIEDESLLKRRVNASIMKNDPELLLEALHEIYEFDIQKIETGVYKIK